MKRRCRAFTLLEVLVALAILAISATAVIRQTGGSLTQLSVLEAKTAAAVLAENQLNLAVLADAFPATGRSTNTVTFNQLQWQVHTEVSATSEPWLRKIEVTVAVEDVDDQPLATLIGYRGKY